MNGSGEAWEERMDALRAEFAQRSGQDGQRIRELEAALSAAKTRLETGRAATESLLAKLEDWQRLMWEPEGSETVDAMSQEYLSFRARWESGEF